MTIRIALMRTGEYVISDMKEASKGEKFVGYTFTNPQIVEMEDEKQLLSEETGESSVSISMRPWFNLSSDENYLIHPENIITIATPIKSITDIYKEKIGESDDA